MSEPTGFRVYPPGSDLTSGCGWWTLGGRRGALLVTEPVGLVGNCSWHRATGETRLGTVHEDDLRPDTVDRSYARADE